ncbi:hypothetical protein HYQ46_012672 [Verticillium longisporum]|nr:hypothetical protein HYQ44_003095 [Verticillium longisporum]KAG7151541.1 hypothetical protein HYQ46_012672 [Verticillium longisporum]
MSSVAATPTPQGKTTPTRGKKNSDPLHQMKEQTTMAGHLPMGKETAPNGTPTPPATPPQSAKSTSKKRRVEAAGSQAPVTPANSHASSETLQHSRPPLPRETQSAPIVLQHGTKKSSDGKAPGNSSPYQIDASIGDLLKSPTIGRESSDVGKVGHIYVCPVVNCGHHRLLFKIGIARNSVQARLNDISKVCERGKLEPLNAHQRPIRQYKRAERLIHAELRNFKAEFECNCGSDHREYFDIDKHVALEVTHRWTVLCEANPWDRSHKLQSFWEHRLNRRPQCDETETVHDHEQRAKRWRQFINPEPWDIAVYNVVSVATSFMPWRWHWVALLQSLYLSYVTFPDPVSVLSLVALVVWMTMERDLKGTPLFWETTRTIDENLFPTPKAKRTSADATSNDKEEEIQRDPVEETCDHDTEMRDAELSDTSEIQVTTPSRKSSQQSSRKKRDKDADVVVATAS